MKPAAQISVIVEGYNESCDLGSIEGTLSALGEQRFPLAHIEIVLVGSAAQADLWRETFRSEIRFHSIQCIGLDDAHYYALKNHGARAASAPILAFTDSDARPDPNWAATIVQGIRSGADVVAGISLFRNDGGIGLPAFMLPMAASISWGFLVSRDAQAAGLLNHNLGIRADLFQRVAFREDLGRTCAGSFFYSALVESGACIRLQAAQRVHHNFTLHWWLTRLHVRFGHEVFRLRRLGHAGSTRWASRLGLFEPVLTAAWHVVLDVPQWWRFSRVLGYSWWRRLAAIPALFVLSIPVRTSEAAGMYLTMAAPERMQRFAHSN